MGRLEGKIALITGVSDNTPLNVHNSSTMPAAIPRIAERNDHQNPGAGRIQKVVIKPTTPLMRMSQPRRISTASVAMGGIATAAPPRMERMIPSTRNSTQCSWD